jgi:hypothetical protein
MAILPVDHNIPILLRTLRPGALWGWTNGPKNDTDSLVWNDLVQIEPTEQEFLDEKIALDTAQTTRDATNTTQRGRSQTAIGTDPQTLTPPQTAAILGEILIRMQALDDDGLILPVDQWGSGRL